MPDSWSIASPSPSPRPTRWPASPANWRPSSALRGSRLPPAPPLIRPLPPGRAVRRGRIRGGRDASTLQARPPAGSVAIHVRHHRDHEGIGRTALSTRCSTSWSRVWSAWSTGATTRPDWPWWARPPPTTCGGPGPPTAPARSTTWPSGPRAPRRPPRPASATPGGPRTADRRSPTPTPTRTARPAGPGAQRDHREPRRALRPPHRRRPPPRVGDRHRGPGPPHRVPPNGRPDHHLAGAVGPAVAEVRGAFAVAVVHTSEPTPSAARRVSPLIMGVTDGAAFLASDIPAILGLPTTS